MRKALAALWFAAGLCPAASQIFTGLPPAVPPLTGQEKVPADTGIAPPSVTFTTQQLAQFSTSLNASSNFLIAGDASQNLFQRGIVGPTATTTVLFGPDRWAYWGTAATPMSVGQDLLGIATLPGFSAAYKMQRQSGSTGTDMLCMAQEISSANSRMLQGQVVDLDFYVFGGANLSATQMGIFIITGTGTDEGVSKLAFGFNGGGGGSAGWTGQNRVVGALFSPIFIGKVTQPAVVGRMPTNETEVGVVLCMTPTGTAGASDFLDFSGIQLRTAPALASYAAAFTAYTAWSLPTPPFVWRLNEAALQQAYYWRINEGPALSVMASGCRYTSPTNSDCLIAFPVPMGKVPTMAFAPGFATDSAGAGLFNCQALSIVPGMVATNLGAPVECVAGTGNTVRPAAFLYNNGGTGMIAADAELH